MDAINGGAKSPACYDYEASVAVRVTADVAEQGKILIAGKLLREITRELPNKPVELSTDDVRLTLRCGSATFTLMLLPEAEYPQLPALPPAAAPSAATCSGPPWPRSRSQPGATTPCRR